MSDAVGDFADWQTPALDPLTDVGATADVTAPIRNLIPGSVGT